MISIEFFFYIKNCKSWCEKVLKFVWKKCVVCLEKFEILLFGVNIFYF